MKAIFSIIGILFFLNINAQKFDCSSKIKEYQDFFQAKKVDESFLAWNEVRKNCPKENEKIYTEGLDIFQYKIDNASTPEEKEKLIRDVMKLYDQYNTNFPLSIPDFEVRKAMFMYNNSIKAKEQMDDIFALLESGFTKAPKNISDANAIYLYFSLYYEKYKSGDKTITPYMLIDKYMLANSMLTELQTTKPEKSNEYKTAQKGIQALAKDLNSCANLSAYFEKNFESNKENPDWLNNALTNFSLKCASENIYYKLAEANYKAKVTSASAYFMGMASMRQRKMAEATNFLIESESLETDPAAKAKLDYSLATGLLSNDKIKAKELLKNALTLDPKMGKAYLFLAELYTNNASECEKNDFEKKAVYYLATETIKKAIIIEPRLKPTVEKMAAKYAPQSLTAEDITKAKMNGKSITIGCWINETITFPPKK